MSTRIRWIKIDVMETCSVFVFGAYIHYGVAGSRTRLDRRLHTPSALAFCIHIYYGDAGCRTRFGRRLDTLSAHTCPRSASIFMRG